MLSKTLRLNFCYLKNISIIHPRYYPKITGKFLKIKPKSFFSVSSLGYMINHNENEDGNEK